MSKIINSANLDNIAKTTESGNNEKLTLQKTFGSNHICMLLMLPRSSFVFSAH